MTDDARILDELRRAYRGGSFHGPAIFEILEGVDAESAARKSIPGAHSIWELVLHVATWNRIPVRRIRERRAIDPTDAENFPAPGPTSEAAWAAAKEALAASVDEVAATVETLPPERFSEIVPGRTYTVVAMLDGVIQHALYHAGQMALVKKAGEKSVSSARVDSHL
ncbi:MAG TPA: DinB family protein [Thermoanaerobaculia bacterium]|nr:DinB family protein [Thermoanaerobaculia bacterium]